MVVNACSKPYSQVFIDSPFYNAKNLYKKRRKAMLSKLDSFFVIAGMPIEPGSEEAFVQTWNKMVQEPALQYLTGINQPGCYLLLDPKTGDEILFVPPKDPFKEFWIGKRLGYLDGDNEVSRVTGISDVRPVDELLDTVVARAKKLPKGSDVYAYFFEKFKEDHNDRFRHQLLKALKGTGVSLKSAAALQSESDGDLAFPTIVAGGENACCLHYVKKDEPLKAGELVLLDFGIRIGSLHSDISRTVPVSGKFNPLQKMLYEIVLEAGLEYQKFVRPGVSLKEIGNIPWNFIVQKLQSRLVDGAKGSYKLLYDVRPHGVSHFIGEQIHEGEPGTRSLDKVLQPGMLISCEPGLYGEFKATIDGKTYREKIGIRIEDDLLITKDGFRNISENIPKTVKDLEALLR